jgi:hypothetical protein
MRPRILLKLEFITPATEYANPVMPGFIRYPVIFWFLAAVYPVDVRGQNDNHWHI